MTLKSVWKLLYSNKETSENPRKIYSRFILSPVNKGDAKMMATTLRRVLLGDLEGVCITKAKFHGIHVPHKYSPIFGIEEYLFDILENLQKIVLRSNSQNKVKASIRAIGPGRVTAQDIHLPSSVTVVDTTQVIANLTEAVDFSMDLEIERGRGSRCIQEENNPQDGTYFIDAVFMPVEKVSFSIHDFHGNNEKEVLFFVIETNGSITPTEALYEASNRLMKIFHISIDIGTNVEKKETISRLIIPKERTELQYDQNLKVIKNEMLKIIIESIQSDNENFMDLSWSSYPIDRLNICRSTYLSLINFNIETIADLLRELAMDGLAQVPGIPKEEYLEIVRSILNLLKTL